MLVAHIVVAACQHCRVPADCPLSVALCANIYAVGCNQGVKLEPIIYCCIGSCMSGQSSVWGRLEAPQALQLEISCGDVCCRNSPLSVMVSRLLLLSFVQTGWQLAVMNREDNMSLRCYALPLNQDKQF